MHECGVRDSRLGVNGYSALGGDVFLVEAHQAEIGGEVGLVGAEGELPLGEHPQVIRREVMRYQEAFSVTRWDAHHEAGDPARHDPQ